VQERITKANPLDEQNFVNLAHTLQQLGRTDAARAVLETLAQRAAISEDSLGRVAAAYLDLGDSARAHRLYEQAASNDPFARNWAVLLEYARLQKSLGDFDGSKKTLRAAFTVPANSGYGEIVDWLVASGRLDRFEEELAGFDLAPPRMDALRRALFAYFEKAGRPADALALAETHPRMLQPSFAIRVRKMAAAAHDFPRGVKLLDRLAAQTESAEEYSLELARLRGDWAQEEIAAGQADSALAQLRIAQEHHPELYEIASRLSALQQQRGDRKGAVETLEAYLAVGKVPVEIEQARAQLARLRAGG
jgi:tetratricopeptide (TPR) repeat protein